MEKCIFLKIKSWATKLEKILEKKKYIYIYIYVCMYVYVCC